MSDISDYDDNYVETRSDVIVKRLQRSIKNAFKPSRKERNVDEIVHALSKHYNDRSS
jgi:hypothetical protein